MPDTGQYPVPVPTKPPEVAAHSPESNSLSRMIGLICGLVGGMTLMIVVTVVTIAYMRLRNRRRRRQEEDVLPPDISPQACTEVSSGKVVRV